MPTTFTTTKQIELLLTSYGLDQFVDEAGVITNAINAASAMVRNVLCSRYDAADLTSDEAIKEITTIFAMYRVCSTAGNMPPSQVNERYLEAKEWLEKYASGEWQLCGVVPRDNETPVWSNLKVDQRYARNKIRVISETSSDVASDLSQDLARQPTDEGYRNG